MKLSCCAYSYRDLLESDRMTLEQFLDTAVELGLDGVELTSYYFAEESDEYLNHLKREVYRRGLDVSATAMGGSFASADAAERRRQIAHVKDWLEKSARLGSSVLRVFAGAAPEGVETATAQQWVIKGLAECAEVAARCGVMLALENHHGLTADAAGTLALIEPFKDNPWIGLDLDFGNFTGDIYAEFAACAPHALTTHAKVSGRLGQERVLVDYRKVVPIMREAGYRGYLAIEYEEPEDPVVGVSRFAAYLRGCLIDA